MAGLKPDLLPEPGSTVALSTLTASQLLEAFNQTVGDVDEVRQVIDDLSAMFFAVVGDPESPPITQLRSLALRSSR